MAIRDFFSKTIEEINEVEFKLLESEKKAIDDINFDTPEHKEEKKKKTAKEDKKHYEGHRKRLKDKILENDIENLADYELLEAALMYAIPRNDVKPLAKKLLTDFKSLKNIFYSKPDTLSDINGVGKYTVAFFKVINEIYCRFNKAEIQDKPLLNSPEKVSEYCQARMSHLHYEQFRVIFLDRKNKLIKDEVIQTGTIDKAAVFPRELVKKAISLAAGGMILVHNHPSGDPTPSRADIEITENIKKAANLMEVFLYDHLIIGRNSYYSMKSNNKF